MSHPRIPDDKQVDPFKLDAWIQMNTVNRRPEPDAAYLYVRDLAGDDLADPVKLQALIDAKTLKNADEYTGEAIIYLDDLMQGFRGTRLEPDQVIAVQAAERLKHDG